MSGRDTSVDRCDATNDHLEAAVRDRLRNVVDPCSAARGIGNDIVEMGLVRDVHIDDDDGRVTVALRLTTPACMMVANFQRQLEEEVGSLPGVSSVALETDSGLEWTPEMMSEEARERREAYLTSFRERTTRDAGQQGVIQGSESEP